MRILKSLFFSLIIFWVDVTFLELLTGSIFRIINRGILEEPFPKDEIKYRKGGFNGEMLPYLTGESVISRLNESFNASWNFEIVKYEILSTEVIALGKLTAKDISKEQFGACRINRDKETGEPMNIGDALKGAATDSLKKCATLFGVGLYLYKSVAVEATEVLPVNKGNGDDRRDLQQETKSKKDVPGGSNGGGNKGDNGNSGGNGHDEEPRVTQRQINYLVDIARQRNINLKELAEKAFLKTSLVLTELQNEADRGATKLRNEAYFPYAAETKRGSNEGM